MKRIIFLLITLQILIASVCNAFEPPTDKRWLWLGSTDKTGCWFDTQSLKYKINNEYEHKNHQTVDAWILFYNATDDISFKQRCSYDLTCEKYKVGNSIFYDKQGNVTYTYDFSLKGFESIAPETWAETILQTCQYFWDNDTRNNLK